VDRPERQYPRYAHEAVITLITPGQEVSGRTRNVSRGGLCATLAEEIAVGTEIQIDVQLVFDLERQSEALRLPARIAWCTGIDNGFQIGVRFLALDEWTAECLTMFLRYLDDEDSTDDEPAAASLDDRFR
jgi:PilZ domain